MNELTADTAHADVSLEALVRSLGPGDRGNKLFNAAAQAWNHDFYWRSMSPGGGGEPGGDLAAALAASFGSVDAFRDEFAAAPVGNFASGWGWLVFDTAAAGAGPGALRIVQTDVEHLANWEFASANYAAALHAHA